MICMTASLAACGSASDAATPVEDSEEAAEEASAEDDKGAEGDVIPAGEDTEGPEDAEGAAAAEGTGDAKADEPDKVTADETAEAVDVSKLSSVWSGLPRETGLPDFGLDKEEVMEKGYTIGFSQCILDNPYRLNMVGLAKAWCDEWGVNYIEMDGEGDPYKEVSNIEALISQEVDAIVISSHAGTALTPAVQKAAEAQIPVIFFDGGKPFDDWTYACWMSTDDYEMAMMACDLMVRETGGEGKIIELKGGEGSFATDGRSTAVTDTVKNNRFELVASRDCGGLRETAIEETAKQLEDHPDIKAVIAHNDEMALGAIEAVKATGRTPGKDILVYSCSDYQENAFEAIKAGELQCTQSYSGKGDLACETAVAVLEGKEVPHLVNLGTEQATAENVDTRTFAY